MRKNPKGLKRYFEPKTGKVYCYHRATGKRLSAEYGTAEFFLELAILNKSHPSDTIEGTIGHMIATYKASPEFTRLKDRSKADYGRVMDWLAPTEGMPVDTLDSEQVTELRNEAFKQHKLRFANSVVQVISRMCNVVLKRNPTTGVKFLKPPTGTPKLNRSWTPEERQVVFASVPTKILAPLEFMSAFGVRIGDTLRLPRSAYREGSIEFTTSKSGVRVKHRCAPTLMKLIERDAGKVFLFENGGKQWTRSALDNVLQRIVKRLEAEGRVQPGLTPHGLRHSFATELRQLGLPDRVIADALGQRNETSVGSYTRTADMEASNAAAVQALHLSRTKSKTSRKTRRAEGK